MQRTIVTHRKVRAADGAPRAQGIGEGALPPDSYVTRVLKLIPAEVVSLYVTLQAMIAAKTSSTEIGAWALGVFLLGLLAVPFYLRFIAKVGNWGQILLSTAAYLVWVAALGGPLEAFVSRLAGGVMLVVFTFILPAFAPKVTEV